MTTKILWGRRALILALSGLGLAQTRCGSAPADFFSGSAGIGAAGENAAGAAHANAGSAGIVGQSGGTSDEAGAGGGAVSSQFVFDSQVLPTSSSSYALDLDGDAKPENAYGRVLSALSAFGFQAQAAADAELAAGRGLQLLALDVPSSSANGSATLELWRAQDQANPDFGGSGSFVVDSLVPSARFGGVITGDELHSVKAKMGETLPRMLLHLPLGGAVDLPVSVYAISFQIAANGLTQGQLNGAALASDVDAIVPPALAAQFDRACAGTSAQSQPCQTALGLLDSNHDQRISAEELRSSSAVTNALAPDVKLFDAQGKFAPDSAAAVKDALSVGFVFTAVGARISQVP